MRNLAATWPLGAIVLAIDYLHAPQYHFPTQLEDVEAALSYIPTHVDEWFIDIDRIAVMGRSADAHLASLYAYRSTTVPVPPVVNYYGSNDLLRGYYDPPFPDPLNVRAILRTFLGGTPDQ